MDIITQMNPKQPNGGQLLLYSLTLHGIHYWKSGDHAFMWYIFTHGSKTFITAFQILHSMILEYRNRELFHTTYVPTYVHNQYRILVTVILILCSIIVLTFFTAKTSLVWLCFIWHQYTKYRLQQTFGVIQMIPQEMIQIMIHILLVK